MEIVIHFRKKRLWFDICIILLIFLVLEVLTYVLAYVRIYIAPIVFLAACLTAWPWVSRTFQVLFFQQPALIINEVGIQLFPAHIPGHFFMKWSEIQKIAVEQYGVARYVSILLKEEKKYVAHLSLFKRFATRLWSIKGQPFTHIALLLLDTPPIEIFRQISHGYARELDEYGVHLQL